MSAEVLSNAGAEIRDNLITTAVKFLTNPNVQRCTLESKERFLRSKGLTEFEIQKALEKCGDLVEMPSLSPDLLLFHHTRRSWFRENILPLIIYGGFAYGCYWFYKNCIRHLLFVEEPKRKSTSECIDELRKSLDILNSNVSSLRGEMQGSLQQNALRTQLDNIKSDISSVKGILLNRNQFPTIKRSEPPSIPAWQRQSEEATSTEAAGDEKKKPHRSRSQRSESGGSNSSEGEQATKNSDSSLEIMCMPAKDNIVILKPDPPMSPYMTFLDEFIAKMKAENPKLRDNDLVSKGCEVWSRMTNRTEWEIKAAESRAQYKKDLAAYYDYNGVPDNERSEDE
ncbi:peroxisomal membrane protein PEX14 isoform X2 [Plodia interpunctella]|nr:peroxisomal membrane protein PEX14 isoform X2 [Plodia interpunctella]